MAKPPKNKLPGSLSVKITTHLSWFKRTDQLLAIIAMLIITAVCYAPALDKKKQFTNWDDSVYVTEQKLITSLDAKNIGEMFSINHPVSLNYHPLTVLSLAVNYNLSKLNPYGYFLTNIIFHLLNTFLVFIFLYRLTNKYFWLAFLPALFFGIHPMHVESVAWISERKDVLYVFFFLLSCIFYISYLDRKKIPSLIFCFLFFVFSCLSKAMAVSLPLVLLLIDYYKGRKFSSKQLLEKFPFIIISVVTGIIAIKIQASGAIARPEVVTFIQHIDFIAYGFMMYWVKLILPLNLSAFYKYPGLINGTVPIIYHLSPFIALIFLSTLFYWFRKKDTLRFRNLIFGLGLFIFSIAMVLQIIMVGSAIMADRYSYLSYTGAFFLIFAIALPASDQKKIKNISLLTIISIALVFGYLTFERVKIWRDNEMLWTDVIEKDPIITSREGNTITVHNTGVATAYKNRGLHYRQIGEMDKALKDFEMLMLTNSTSPGDYSNLGNLYALQAKGALAEGNKEKANSLFRSSLETYAKGLKIDSHNYEIYLDRGISYDMMGNNSESLKDFLAAYYIKPENYLNTNIAFEYLLLKNYEESIVFCNKKLLTNPNDSLAYFYRGTCFINQGKFSEAVNDLKKSITINPSNGNAWFNLSIAYNKSGNTAEALEAAINAQKNNYPVSNEYLNSLKKK